MSDKPTEGCRRFSRKKPCKECPYSRESAPGATGGADPTVYVGQAWGPFWLPCHMDPDYKQATAHRNTRRLAQCAGAAIFRANVGVDGHMPEGLHQLPGDATLSFATPAELIAHHRGTSLEEADELLRDSPPDLLLVVELIRLASKHPESAASSGAAGGDG